jgi:hypothetical protein
MWMVYHRPNYHCYLHVNMNTNEQIFFIHTPSILHVLQVGRVNTVLMGLCECRFGLGLPRLNVQSIIRMKLKI